MALKTDCTTPEWIIKREMIMKRRAANRVRDEDASPYDVAFNQALSRGSAPAVHPSTRSVAPRHSSESRTFSSCKTATQSPTRGSVPGFGGYVRPSSVVNGGRQRWLSADNQRRVMGEDACPGSGRDDSSSPFEPFEIMKGFPFENDQEFQYGPGIVDKLKTKFINLSLKERENHEDADGKLRRYSSLENLLENDFQATDFVRRKRPIGTIGANGGGHTLPICRGGFKRAKSMETLLFESEQKVHGGNLRRRPLSAGGDVIPTESSSALINENVVIIEQQGKSDDPLSSKVVRSLNRQTSSIVTHINDEELPKPDIVKTCKLIFEPAVRRAVNHNSARKAPVVRHSAKNWANGNNNNRYASTATQQHAAIITENTETVSLASPKSCAKANLFNGDALVTSSLQNGEVQATDMCEINNDKNRASPGVKRVSDDTMARVRSQGTSLTFGVAKMMAHPPKKSPTLATGRPKVTIPKIPSPVRHAASRRSAAEVAAIRAQKVTSNKPVALEVRSPTKEAVPVKVDHVSEPVIIATPVEEHASAVTPKMPEEPTEVVLPPPPPPLVNGDVTAAPDDVPQLEKVKRHQEPEILKPSTLMGNKKQLWQKPPPTTTTMVFDFRGKDVKSHLPVNPAPFGCKPAPRGTNRRKKRSVSPPVGDVVTNGAINGVSLGGDLGTESKDYDDDDEDFEDGLDDLDLGGSLPHPSGIVFSGGNVIVGKGALLYTRNKKLKIQFNDGATSIYEYQSEASATDDFDADHSNNESPPNSVITSPSLVNSPALSTTSSGGLANYTPSMLSSTESFQLGVHRASHETPPSPKVADPPKAVEEDEIKPADPNETSSWSSSTSSDLLF